MHRDKRLIIGDSCMSPQAITQLENGRESVACVAEGNDNEPRSNV